MRQEYMEPRSPWALNDTERAQLQARLKAAELTGSEREVARLRHSLKLDDRAPKGAEAKAGRPAANAAAQRMGQQLRRVVYWYETVDPELRAREPKSLTIATHGRSAPRTRRKRRAWTPCHTGSEATGWWWSSKRPGSRAALSTSKANPAWRHRGRGRRGQPWSRRTTNARGG